MQYHHSKKVSLDFNQALQRIKEELQKEGFGIITEIDLTGKFKEKLGIDFRNYKILGACNPAMAYQAIEKEDKIGLLLPCNILIQDGSDNTVEISVIEPLASIGAIESGTLQPIATEVSEKLQVVLSKI